MICLPEIRTSRGTLCFHVFNVAALPGDPGKHGAPAAWRPENAGAGVGWTAGGEPLAGGNPGRSEGLRGKDLSLRQEEGRRPGPREPCPPGALRLRQRTCNRPAPCCPGVMDARQPDDTNPAQRGLSLQVAWFGFRKPRVKGDTKHFFVSLAKNRVRLPVLLCPLQQSVTV